LCWSQGGEEAAAAAAAAGLEASGDGVSVEAGHDLVGRAEAGGEGALHVPDPLHRRLGAGPVDAAHGLPQRCTAAEMMMTRMVVVMRTRCNKKRAIYEETGIVIIYDDDDDDTTTKRGRGGEAHVPLPKEESMPEGMTPT
jgi:hypothetical protein